MAALTMNNGQSVHLSWVGKNLLALLVILGATVFLFLLRGTVNTPVIALLYLLPVVTCTTWWGLGAGIIASVSAFLSFNYFFIPPYYTFAVHQTPDILALFVFLIVAVVISQLITRVKSGLAEVQAREREVLRLYELSVALGSTWHPEEIANTLARHLVKTFAAQAAEVMVQSETDQSPTIARISTGLPLSGAEPERIPLVVSSRGQVGEIRLSPAQSLKPAEDGLLRAFASQGALALERAFLMQAETRAKILEDSDRLKSVLLSSVSHELRTPLVTIKAAATSLRSGEVDWKSPARDELLAALEEEADNMNQLIADLLNMSRLESGALTLQRQWNVLAEIVDTAIERVERATQHHHLDVTVSDDLPLVSVDSALMQQVVVNLLNNCAKYAPPDTTISINAQEQGASAVLIQISNQGPPVPDEELERIFDKFHRITAADRVPGLGLGLSICRGIIEAHGGRIWAENLPGGFAFLFTLPVVWEGMSPPEVPVDTDTL